MASDNTSRAVETCGILAGIEIDEGYLINTLIIPKQEGYVDHCFMSDELGLFEA